jgi:thiamine-phosphate pyrophosphorylase
LLRARKTPVICYVTDRKSLGAGRGSLLVREKIQWAMQAGADWVQIREKDLPGRELLELVRDATKSGGPQRSATDARKDQMNASVIVNDRLDVALAAGARGVHLGHESVNARDVVDWCRRGNAPAEFLVGVSCHSLEEAREAASAGASYIFFGPVFETPSKRGFGEPQGLERLAEISASVTIPVIAIGGVDEVNALACVRAGAAGIAAIRMFQEACDAHAPVNLVQNIRR